jgi:hypothetical protein
MSEHQRLVALACKLGAAPAQAEILARQLAKRAEQLAVERGLTRIAAMAHLLELFVKGRQGETPAGFEGRKPPSPSASSPPAD